MEKLLGKLIQESRDLAGHGRVADYIPILAEACPNDIGICIMDIDGNIHGKGSYDHGFTLQSISKVMALMLALLDNGKQKVFSRVGMKPTIEPFNSLHDARHYNQRIPSNPMINAGAMVVTDLIGGRGREKADRLLNLIRDITSNPNIDYDEETYLSEKGTAERNRAIAYLLKDLRLLDGDVEEVLDAYFRQCSIQMDCMDLAKVGLFLANRCKAPNIIWDDGEEMASLILAIMNTCGMYDFSGEYAVKVGVPSKSGVAGGILAAVPNRFGIGIYGPSLDQYGNSIVGCKMMEELSKELDLNIFR